MIVANEEYAIKKLSQIGYYRLSGFWHTTREFHNGSITDNFVSGTKFDSICELYIFDKKLRILLLDIIERVEVHVRNIIAHELGRIDSLAYQYAYFIDKKQRDNHKKWLIDLDRKINRSQDDFISHHMKQGKPIPFWAVVNVWDFGSLSKYYSLLNGDYQDKIVKHFNIDRNTFENWLIQINHLRNYAAHHNRVWNRIFSADISIPSNKPKFTRYKKAVSYFNNLPISDPKRVFSRISVLWYLVSQFSQNYKWLDKVNKLINSFPDVPNAKPSAMGFIQKDNCFPVSNFITNTK